MIIFSQLHQQLFQLQLVLEKLTTEQYQYKSRYLANASIGGHSRHIIELLQCTIIGYETSNLNYINRERNILIEHDKVLAINNISTLMHQIEKADKSVKVMNENGSSVLSSYFRELVYNVEHIIHHLALIKVSLIEMDLDIVDEQFGMAYSTIQYKKSLQKV